MNKIFFASLFTIVTTGANALIAHCAPAYPPNAATRPNIVFFIADDHSIRDSSVYGATDVRTPNMERLSAAGLTFERAFVASPSCAPSRAAFLTGLMPARNGAEPNHSKPRPDIKVLPAYLHDQGYEVVAIGKVGHYDFVKDYGFDYVSHYTFHDDEAIPAAIQWLNARTSKKPLAFFVGTNFPHVPWPKQSPGYNPTNLKLSPALLDTPETRQWRARYYAAVSRFDTELGEVYDATRAKLGPNTFFIQSSDHGAQWPFGKWNLYDEGIHVPMIVSWPGVIKPKTRTRAMVSWVDILPTLIEVAGGKAPTDIDGRSFLPVLRGQTQKHRERIFTTHSGDGDMNVYPMRSVRTEKWKYILNLHPEFEYTTHIDRNADGDANSYWDSWEAAPTDRRATAIINRYHERPAEELYDLDTDPDELHNLAALPAYARTRAGLRHELEQWMNAQGDKRTVFGKPHLLNAPDDMPTPRIAGKELMVTCRVTPGSPNASGVVVAQGGNRQGYVLYLSGGKPIFVVRQNGQIYTAAASNAPASPFSLEAHLNKDGAMTLAVNGTIVARGKAPGVFAVQPAEGFSIGEDTQAAVGDYQAPYPLNGKIENVQVGEDESSRD